MAGKHKRRADGRYMVQVQIGTNDIGRPKYKNLYARTLADLEKKERDFRQNLEKGIIVNDEGLTVADWANHWLELYKMNLEYNTIEMYKTVVNVHIIPTIGYIKLKNLKTYHVQEMINLKAKEGLTRTLEKIKITMGQMIKQAIINEFMYKDIMLGVEMPKKQIVKKRALTNYEINLIKNATLDLKEKTFILTLLYTGLRRGEVLALNRSDIDLKEKTINVDKSIVYVGNNPTIKNSTKSVAGERVIPLPDVLCNCLSEYTKEFPTFTVFSSPSGEIMSKAVFRRFWDNIIKKIEQQVNINDIKVFNTANDITPHIFRHTYATILYQSGVDIKTAQHLLGHSTIQVTMDIYTHLDNDRVSIAKNKINDFISGDVVNGN